LLHYECHQPDNFHDVSIQSKNNPIHHLRGDINEDLPVHEQLQLEIEGQFLIEAL